MRLERIQNFLRDREYDFSYTEEDGCGSVDFLDRGLAYHIWEYGDDDGVPCGIETNLMHAGHMEEIEGDYEQTVLDMLQIFDNRVGM